MALGEAAKKIGVLLVENNPLDRLVIDEILCDSGFRVRYSIRGVPVNEKRRRTDGQRSRLVFEDLMESDVLAEEYPIVLLDLGLDRESENILADPKYRAFLASPDETEEVFLVTWGTEPSSAGSPKSIYEELTRSVKGLDYLLDRTKANFQRVFAVVSHFVDTSNAYAIRRLLKMQYLPMLLHFQDDSECAEACIQFLQSMDGLVINKSDLRELPQRLLEAHDARRRFCREVVDIGDCRSTSALRSGGERRLSFLDVVGAELLFVDKPQKGPRLITVLDYSDAVDFAMPGWQRITRFALGRCEPICRSMRRVRDQAKRGNVVADLGPAERHGTIQATLDELRGITELANTVILCRLGIEVKELHAVLEGISSWGDPPRVTVTLVYDRRI